MTYKQFITCLIGWCIIGVVTAGVVYMTVKDDGAIHTDMKNRGYQGK